MPFFDRLKEIRKDMRYSQQEMAEYFGVGISTWQRYENGKAFPSVGVLVDLALRGYNIHWILTGDGDKQFCDSIATDPFLRDIWEWLEQMAKEDESYRDWFKVQFKLSFPMFKDWLLEKETRQKDEKEKHLKSS